MARKKSHQTRGETLPSGATGVKVIQYRTLMLKVYSSVLQPRSAIYCSAPITSGKRYLEWLTSKGKSSADVDEIDADDLRSHLEYVITPNREHAKQFIERLRARVGHPVIDPTAVPQVPGWRQQDWLNFWEEVITLYAREVVFLNGWEFSFGSVHEFWLAHKLKLPVYDEYGHSLGLEEGLEKIARAVSIMRESGASASRLESVVRLLYELSADHSTNG